MEWFITEDGKYRIESLSAVTFDGALRVIKESYCRDEAASIGTGINKNEIAVEEFLELCADAALDGVSLVAVHVETGEVAAAAFNKLHVVTTDTSDRPFYEKFATERCTQASSRSLVEFCAILDTKYDFFRKFDADCGLEIMFLATLSQHRYHKLATLLCKMSIEVAKKLKDGPVATMTVKDFGPKYASMPDRKPVSKIPKFCQAVWTAKSTQKIGQALGFTVYMRIPLSEFSFNGKTYAERLGAEPWCEAAAMPV